MFATFVLSLSTKQKQSERQKGMLTSFTYFCIEENKITLLKTRRMFATSSFLLLNSLGKQQHVEDIHEMMLATSTSSFFKTY
jgi:hypothetical protein